jgi:hypothetical protein
LSERINQEHGASRSYWSRVSNTNPRTHTEAVAKLPLPAHVSINADEKVENNKLEGSAIIKPFVK